MGNPGIREIGIAAGCIALGAISLFGQLLVQAPTQPASLIRATKAPPPQPLQFAEAYNPSDLMTDATPCVDLDNCIASSETPAVRTAAKPPPINLKRIATALVEIESAGDSERVGLHGERGLMQIKAVTWESVTRRIYGKPLDFSRAFEKELNLKIGTAYLEELHGFLKTHGDELQGDERMLLLACYNCGPTRVASSGFDFNALPFQTQDYAARACALADAL